MIVPTIDGNPGSATVCSPECAELYEEMCLLRSSPPLPLSIGPYWAHSAGTVIRW